MKDAWVSRIGEIVVETNSVVARCVQWIWLNARILYVCTTFIIFWYWIFCIFGVAIRDFESVHRQQTFLFSQRPDQLWGPPTLILNGYWGSFLGIKRPGCEINHSLRSSAEVKNKWIRTFADPICHHEVYRDKFNFYMFMLFIYV